MAALKLLNYIFDGRVIQVGLNLVCLYDKKFQDILFWSYETASNFGT